MVIAGAGHPKVQSQANECPSNWIGLGDGMTTALRKGPPLAVDAGPHRAGRESGEQRPRLGAGWLVAAGIAVYSIGASWDIAWHIDVGRDRFLTPPHDMIIGGMVLVVAGGLVGSAARWWRQRLLRPGLLIAASAAILQLVALTVDNWWHNAFGVDVTLWSPPHLLLISLGWLAVVGLLAEVARTRPSPYTLAVCAGLLLGVTTVVLAEYDFGVPAFALMWAGPVLAGCLGSGLMFSRRLSGMRWAGTVAATAALLLRAVMIAYNMAAGRSLPTPPLGLLAGGLVFDLLLLAAPRRATPARSSPRREGVALLGAWLATFAVQAVVTEMIGKFWWPRATLAPAFGMGLVAVIVGGALGSAVGGTVARIGDAPDSSTAWGRSPREVPMGTRLAVGVAAAAALLGLAVSATKTQVVSTDTSGPPAGAAKFSGTLVLSGNHAVLSFPGVAATDWASVMRTPRQRHEGYTWLGGLTWHHGVLEGDLSSRGTGSTVTVGGASDRLIGVTVILAGRGHSWWGESRSVEAAAPVQVASTGLTTGPITLPITLSRSAAPPPKPPAPWLSPLGYLLVVFVLGSALIAAGSMLGVGPADLGAVGVRTTLAG